MLLDIASMTVYGSVNQKISDKLFFGDTTHIFTLFIIDKLRLALNNSHQHTRERIDFKSRKNLVLQSVELV